MSIPAIGSIVAKYAWREEKRCYVCVVYRQTGPEVLDAEVLCVGLEVREKAAKRWCRAAKNARCWEGRPCVPDAVARGQVAIAG